MRVLLAALLAVAAAARAQNSVNDPGAPWPAYVDLPRATAMGGAHAAIATANDAITVNPAGMSQQRRYHLEVDGLYDSRFPAQALMASIVDTTSSAVGTGFLFERWGSGQPGGRGEGWYGALAYSYALGGNYYVGGETKYYRFATPDGLVRKFAQDAGLLVRRGNFAYALVTKRARAEQLARWDLSAMRVFGCGAEPINPDTMRAFVDKFAPAKLHPQSLLPSSTSTVSLTPSSSRPTSSACSSFLRQRVKNMIFPL